MTSDATSTIPNVLRTSRAGDVQLWSRTLIPTTKEAPTDAEAPSHILLSRAGYIRRVTAGVYDYLPLAWRVLTKLGEIIRQEMNAAGASELLMPAIAPLDLLRETGRADDYGDLLFRFTDRHDRETYLGPTHEEVITELMRSAVSSYKQLPLNLYQIQSKYRDEFRPRAGLLRCREFIMKDAYSFSMDVDGSGGLDEQYNAMYRAYERIFTRCGLENGRDFTIVEAEAGPIGGSASHEFMVNCPTGEDTILMCPETGYAANVEKCAIGPRSHDFEGEPSGELETVHTPDCPGIEDVSKLLKVKTRNMLKCVVCARPDGAEGPRWIIAIVRGDHEVNEGKLREVAGPGTALADAEEAGKAGFVIGYISPRMVTKLGGDCRLIIDPDAARGTDTEKNKPMFWVTGADEKDLHVKHFNWRRELGDALDDPSRVTVADVRNAEAGDPSPKSESARLEAKRGIEVGHIFRLGTKYSEAMGFNILDQNQQRRPVIMGCYGIGVSRTMAACVEMACDEHGIVWPLPIAPYHVLITLLKPDDAMLADARTLADELAAEGFDVLIDDRDERPGGKFKDADLIGVPLRLTLSEKTREAGGVEFKLRTDSGKGEVISATEILNKCRAAAR